MACIVGILGVPLPHKEAGDGPFWSAISDRTGGPISACHWETGALVQGNRPADSSLLPARPNENDLAPVVTFAGLLTNRKQLLTTLSGLPQNPTESELIGAAYRKWGNLFAEHLEGRFALILWDPRNQVAICVRDRFGQMPLFYARQGSALFLASDVKTLLTLPAVPKDPNLQSVHRYLAGMPPRETDTYFQHIQRFPAGHYLILKDGHVSFKRYWRLAESAPYSDLSFEDQARHFKSLLEAAIEPAYTSSTNPIFFLSGGLDSSSITAAARRMVSVSSIKAVSMILPDDPAMNERGDQQAVARMGGIEVTEVNGSKIDYLSSLDQILKEQAGPSLGAGMGLSLHTYQAAQSLQGDVVFDGHGGDETVSYGTGRLNELQHDRAWLTLCYELLRLNPSAGLRTIQKLLPSKPPASFLRRIMGVLLPTVPEKFGEGQVVNLLTPTLHAEPDGNSVGDEDGHKGSRYEQSSHIETVSSPLQSYAFEALDTMAAHRGLEMHYPLWDQKLVEFCISLPSSSKLRHGYDRYIMRQALRNVLPRQILTKKRKCDFAGTALKSIRRDSRDYIEFLFNDELPKFADLIDQKQAAEIGQAVLSNDQTISSGYLTQAVWKLASVAKWLKQPVVDIV